MSIEYMNPIWKGEHWEKSRCIFCGKDVQNRFFSSITNTHFKCDCPEFAEYTKVFNECVSRLAKLTVVAKNRKELWDAEVEIKKREDVIKELQDELRHKNYQLKYDIEDRDKIKDKLIECQRIPEDN